MPKLNSNQIKGCLAMTEVGHGSNVKQIQTRATYDVETEGFYLHTPDYMAAKCWAGNLGKTSISHFLGLYNFCLSSLKIFDVLSLIFERLV